MKSKKKVDQKSMINCMLSGTLIFDGFWKDFGKPKSSIFDHFFDISEGNFGMQNETARKMEKMADRSFRGGGEEFRGANSGPSRSHGEG